MKGIGGPELVTTFPRAEVTSVPFFWRKWLKTRPQLKLVSFLSWILKKLFTRFDENLWKWSVFSGSSDFCRSWVFMQDSLPLRSSSCIKTCISQVDSSLIACSFLFLVFSVVSSELVISWLLVKLFVTSDVTASLSAARCHVFTRESSYCFQHVLAITILSIHLFICLSHGWISQKRCKIGSPNFYHRLPKRL